MKQQIIWNETDTELVRTFISTEDTTIKHKVFSALYNTLVRLIEIAIRTYNLLVTEDIIQDCLLRLYNYTLPRLKIELLKACQQYIFISLKRYILSYFVLNKKQNVIKVELNEVPDSFNYNNVEDITDVQDYRALIDSYIDRRINKVKMLNTTEMHFLIQLKDYLHLNSYDVKGFKKYYNQVNNITDKKVFSQLCYRLQISSVIFN